MHVAIVENTVVTHHGQVGVALHEAGARIDLFKPWLDGVLPKPEAYDALVVFGGEQNALADDTHPYLPALAEVMRAAAVSGKAVLGICLGAQVLARGMGGANHIGTTPEFGWHPVALTEAGRKDPWLSALPSTFQTFEWHSDTFTLPEGIDVLASTATAPAQAFRAGSKAYGTQFHFEASRAVVRDWNKTFPEAVERNSPGWLTRHDTEAAQAGAEADAHGLTLARAWVALI